MNKIGEAVCDAQNNSLKESLSMKRSDQIIYLHLMGLRPAQISRRLATSEQWISQLLSRPPAIRPRKPLRAALPEQKPSVRTKVERKRALSAEQLETCRNELRKGKTWTWLEADIALKDIGLEPPAGDITKLLREASFTYDRSKKRWFK